MNSRALLVTPTVVLGTTGVLLGGLEQWDVWCVVKSREKALGCENTLLKCCSLENLKILKSTEKYILLYSNLRRRLLINSIKQRFKLGRERYIQSSKVYLWANTLKINWKISVPFKFEWEHESIWFFRGWIIITSRPKKQSLLINTVFVSKDTEPLS